MYNVVDIFYRNMRKLVLSMYKKTIGIQYAHVSINQQITPPHLHMFMVRNIYN